MFVQELAGGEWAFQVSTLPWSFQVSFLLESGRSSGIQSPANEWKQEPHPIKTAFECLLLRVQSSLLSSSFICLGRAKESRLRLSSFHAIPQPQPPQLISLSPSTWILFFLSPQWDISVGCVLASIKIPILDSALYLSVSLSLLISSNNTYLADFLRLREYLYAKSLAHIGALINDYYNHCNRGKHSSNKAAGSPWWFLMHNMVLAV